MKNIQTMSDPYTDTCLTGRSGQSHRTCPRDQRSALLLHHLTLPLLLTLFSLHATATAQTSLPAIEVRAERQPEAYNSLMSGASAQVIDTPFSVSTVTVETLREQGGKSLQDLLRNVPGASADLSFTGSHAQTFVLRGFLADSGTGASRVLRDGVRLSNYPFVPAFVDSVQVLRGPGAAVGTRSEPGGTVMLVSKQPALVNAASVSGGIGEFGAREGSVDINRVLSAEDELAARVILNHSEASEWRGVPDRLDGARLAIARSDGQRYRLRLGVEATDQRYKPDFGVPGMNGRAAAIPLNRQLAEPWDVSTTRNRVLDLHGDVAVTPETRLAFDATHLEADSTSLRQSVSAAVPGSPGVYSRVLAYEPGTRRRTDSIATSLTSRQAIGAWTHQLYFGVEHYRETMSQPSGFVTAPASPAIDIFNPVHGLVRQPASIATTLTKEDLDSTILSAQDSIDIGAWTLVGGLQYMKQDFFYGTSGTPVSEDKWSPKLAALYHLTPAQTLYASYSRGTAPNQAASSSGQSLPSRTSKQFEAGWKSAWLGGRLNSELALFWLRQSNMLADDPSTLNAFDKTLAGNARSRGVEASLNGYLTRQLSLLASYANTSVRYGQGSEFRGNVMPNVATHSASLFAHYDWSQQYRSGLGIYAQGRRFADNANTTVMPGYGRLDATQRYLRKLAGGASFELQLSLRNLLDKQYYAASHLHVARYILPGESRSLSLTAVYRF